MTKNKFFNTLYTILLLYSIGECYHNYIQGDTIWLTINAVSGIIFSVVLIINFTEWLAVRKLNRNKENKL